MPQSNGAHVPQLLSPHSRARVPQLLKPARLEPVLHNKRSHRNEERKERRKGRQERKRDRERNFKNKLKKKNYLTKKKKGKETRISRITQGVIVNILQ